MEGSDEPQASGSSSSPGFSHNEPSAQDPPASNELGTLDSGNPSNLENDSTEDMEIEGDMTGSTAEGDGDGDGGNMEVHLDSTVEPVEDMGMEAGPSNPGKRVKVCHNHFLRMPVIVSVEIEVT